MKPHSNKDIKSEYHKYSAYFFEKYSSYKNGRNKINSRHFYKVLFKDINRLHRKCLKYCNSHKNLDYNYSEDKESTLDFVYNLIKFKNIDIIFRNIKWILTDSGHCGEIDTKR